MARYKLTLEYDGTGLVGWQRQKDGVSVQSLLEKATQAFTAETVTATASGRTDAGVHARGQVVHIDLSKQWEAERVLKALNAHLKDKPVSVLKVEEVPDSFHARFSAVARSYEYRMIVRPAPLTLDRNQAWWYHTPLDLEAMKKAATYLLGTHDFSTFRASECQAKSPIKTLDYLEIEQKEETVFFYVKSKSFLHHQVRNIVGSLKLVGTGKWSPQDMKDALEACDRRRGGPTAPACGLTFIAAHY